MELTLRNPQTFPAGTTVKAYPASNWPQANLPPSGKPVGSASAEAVAGADGSIALVGLAEKTRYYAAAEVGGVWRYLDFYTAVPKATPESDLALLEAEKVAREAADATLAASVGGKQPLDSDLTSIAALSTTAFGRALLELANAEALRVAAAAAPATETVKAVAESGEALTVKLSEGTVWSVTLNKNCAITLPTPEAGKSFALRLVQDGSGGRVVTWPANARWSGGVYPQLSLVKESIDIVYFQCVDGANWLGFPGGYAMAVGGSEPQISAVVQTALALKEDAANREETASTSKIKFPSSYGVRVYADTGDAAEKAAREAAVAAEESARKAADALLVPKAGSLWQPSDYSYKIWTGDPHNYPNSSLFGEAGRLELIRVKVPEEMEISKTFFGLAVAGLTLTNAFCAWYQEGKFIVQSASQIANWESTGRKEAVMTAAKTVKAGFLDVAFWVGTAITLPTFLRSTGAGGNPTILNGGLSAENSRYASANTGITTTAPETLGAKTARNISFWAAVA